MATKPVQRLDGWKAIAGYLGRDVRTAQRWRDERGMPVHRVPGGKGGAVFATATELDAWLFRARSTGASAPEVLAPQSNLAAPPASLGPDEGGKPGATAPIDVLTITIDALRRLREPGASRRWWRVATVIAGITAGILTIGGAAIAVMSIEGRRAAPARVEAVGDAIVARAADDSVLWTYQLPERPGSQLDGAVVSNAGVISTARAYFHGPDPDVLTTVAVNKIADSPGANNFLRHEVYCLSSHGKLRWMFYPKTRLTFAGRDFAGQWSVGAWVMVPGANPHLWVSFIDRVWWPSFIVSLGGDGVPVTMFVNSGHIRAFEQVQLGDQGYVLAGGVNNEYRAAALAVLDARDPPSTSPQTKGTPFSCDTCPNQGPRKYFVFPRSEVPTAHGVPYEFAHEIHAVTGASGVDVSVTPLRSDLAVRTVYRFSKDLMPESVAMSDRYWEIHREMFHTGKLDHAPEDCPERTQGVVVRMWRPERGWTDLKVPPTFTPRETR
jgi:hypothetical protein